MQEILRKVSGVLRTRVGYSGGSTAQPTYKQVCTGTTGHAEAIEIVFDPSLLTYGDLLRKYFFRMHDPTTLNRQGGDQGTQYRSAIFYFDEEQRLEAQAAIRVVAESGLWKAPIVTEISPAGPFYPAEDYHQDYLQKEPHGYTCHYLR
jgi:methionine-S-sulfoxide reductase